MLLKQSLGYVFVLLICLLNACTDVSWVKIPGGLKHLSVAEDGTIWGINVNDDIFRRNGGSWTHIDGKLKQISVGSALHVWGVNANDDIFQRNGESWIHIGGKLKYVSAAEDGSVWGVNANDDIYRRNGGSWTHIGGKLKQISVGSELHVWGVNANDDIFRRDGESWTHIGGKLKHVAVNKHGDIAGTNSGDNIFRRPDNHWETVCGGLKQIDIGSNPNILWGVNVNDEIFKANKLRMMSRFTANKCITNDVDVAKAKWNEIKNMGPCTFITNWDFKRDPTRKGSSPKYYHRYTTKTDYAKLTLHHHDDEQYKGDNKIYIYQTFLGEDEKLCYEAYDLPTDAWPYGECVYKDNPGSECCG